MTNLTRVSLKLPVHWHEKYRVLFGAPNTQRGSLEALGEFPVESRHKLAQMQGRHGGIILGSLGRESNTIEALIYLGYVLRSPT